MQVEKRTHHPYYMHEAIMAQPEAFVRTARRNGDALEQFATEAAQRNRLFLVGIGTSFHAAKVGEYLFGAYGGSVDARAVDSFEFALYGPSLRPDDCVVAISHRGSKQHTADGLARARRAGCLTALITGEGGAPDDQANATFRTVAQEKSAAFTVSYTAAISVLAMLAGRVGVCRVGEPASRNDPVEDLLREKIPAAIGAALETGDEVELLAREHAGRRRIWLAGGGPSTVTAEEIALKIKEASYLQAEGMSTEAMLHGPFSCTEAEDLFILIAPDGAAQERTKQLTHLVRALGAPYLVVSDGTPTSLRSDAAGWLTVPAVPEPFNALTCLVPLQLFTYHLALMRGTNPDSFRTDDPSFPRVTELVRL
jgi:glucosamine--fructose-6-phosphate aminotransferase (isomerizing)